jgi:hypothetical protein
MYDNIGTAFSTGVITETSIRKIPSLIVTIRRIGNRSPGDFDSLNFHRVFTDARSQKLDNDRVESPNTNNNPSRVSTLDLS